MNSGFTVFDFGEIYMVIFSGDEVDFVEFGFMVMSNNSVTLFFKIISDGQFGLLAGFSGVFVKGFCGFEI